MTAANPTGDEFLRILAALANPQRLRIVAALTSGRRYVSLLARELGLSRPLVHLHLQRLEAVGLVTGSMEISADGKAMNWYSVTPFAYEIDPQRIAELTRTLTANSLGKDN